MSEARAALALGLFVMLFQDVVFVRRFGQSDQGDRPEETILGGSSTI